MEDSIWDFLDVIEKDLSLFEIEKHEKRFRL